MRCVVKLCKNKNGSFCRNQQILHLWLIIIQCYHAPGATRIRPFLIVLCSVVLGLIISTERDDYSNSRQRKLKLRWETSIGYELPSGGHKSSPIRHMPSPQPLAPTNKWRFAWPGRSWCLLSITGFSATKRVTSATSFQMLHVLPGQRLSMLVIGYI